jgi:type I restriction-modification system DNA methylase subunit
MFVSVPWNSDYEHTKAAQQDQRPCDRDCIRFVTNVRANAWVQLPLLERPEVEAAVAGMAEAGAESRGAVFTRREVVDFILDLAGYTTNKPLHKARVLEPSMGQGDFLTPVIDRLFEAYTRQKT